MAGQEINLNQRHDQITFSLSTKIKCTLSHDSHTYISSNHQEELWTTGVESSKTKRFTPHK